MHPSSYHFFPHSPLYLLLLLLVFGVAVVLIEVGLLSYAYEKMGIERRHVFSLLLLCLLGSSINIPIAELPREPVQSGVVVTYYGVQYYVPTVQHWPSTVIAINVGGALVPTLLAVYLLVKNRLYVRGLLAVVIVAALVHLLAQPVRGVGVVVPTLIPPICAAGVAVAISRRSAAPLAYIAGTLGTLIGADLMNLGHIAGLGAPVASIGGAGTFDGVFLTGIIAVLLA